MQAKPSKKNAGGATGKVKLPNKWEEYLKKGVFKVGTTLEHLIGKAERLGTNIKGSSMSAQPVLSLEGQIQLPKLKEVIAAASEKVIAPIIPSLIDKTALEVREGPARLTKLFKERGASVSVHADMGASAGSYGRPEAGTSSIRSVSSRMPFEDGFFDHIVALFANQYQGDILKGIKEFSRLLSMTGEGVFSDFHPFGMFAKRGNLRLRPAESPVRGVEDYYRICKSAGLKVTAVRESFIDESLRGLFVTEDEKASFRVIKETPLVIYIFVKKS
jgi:SAM-dependent methyltransferase